MTTDLPSVDELRHLLGRLHANDVTWFQGHDRAGSLAWLRDRLSPDDAAAMRGRIDAGDLDWVRERLGLLLREAPVTGLDTSTLAVTETPVPVPLPSPAAPDPTPREERRRRAALLLLPVGVLAGVALGFGLNRWGKTSGDHSLGTVLAAETVPAAPTETTAADVTIAAETTVAAAATAEAADIVDTASGAGGFTKLVAALDAADLASTLHGAGPFTVFAPNDAAFDALPPGVLDSLLDPKNKATLAKVLSYHVVPGAIASADVKTGNVTSVEGSELALVADASGVKVNDATVLVADVAASNGVIHVIDKVLLPPDAGLAIATPAAPETTVAPPTTIVDAATDTTAPAKGDILTTAADAGSFSTLGALVDAAGLADGLRGNGPFTVLAPTDDAFKKLPPELLDALKRPENRSLLVGLLQHHVLAGSVPSTDLRAGTIKAQDGTELTVALDGTDLKIDDARVTIADIAASNGIIHAVDSVIVPRGFDVASLIAPAATSNAAGDKVPEKLTVYFTTGSAVVDAAATEKIAGIVTSLAALKEKHTVAIVGHADSTGNAAANLALSKRRADAVAQAITAGLTAESPLELQTAAKGDTEPAADLAKSRRVTIEIA